MKKVVQKGWKDTLSLKRFFKDPVRVPLCLVSSFLDFAFLFLSGMFMMFMLFTHVYPLLEEYAQSQSGLSSADFVAQNITYSMLAAEILQSLFLISLGVLVLYLLFQGLSWYVAHRSVSKKLFGFWRQFIVSSLVGYICIVGILVAWLYAALAFAGQPGSYAVIQFSVGLGLSIVGLLLIHAYSLAGSKQFFKTWLTSFKKFHKFLGWIFVGWVVLWLEGLVFDWLVTLSYAYAMILGVLVILPTLYVGRVLLVEKSLKK